MGGAAAPIAAVVGAGGSILGGNKAAKAQKQAAQTATDAQMRMFETTQENLRPYMQAGSDATNLLMKQLPTLTRPITMDQTFLESTPGYQFTRNQGLKAVQNAASAKGLGISGSALKDAARFATGLADTTYQNQFQNAVANAQNTYNRLLGIGSLGENAAAGVGNAAVTTGQGIASNAIGAGNAQAAAALQGGAAIGNAANNAYGGYMANNLMNNNGFYGGGYNVANGMISGNGLSPQVYNPTAAANGLAWSDKRLKENITLLGSENGYPVYSFNYKGDSDKYIGVIAQEIAEIKPDAVDEVCGYLAVNYSKLGVEFRRMH